jgi:hypothetical protein
MDVNLTLNKLYLDLFSLINLKLSKPYFHYQVQIIMDLSTASYTDV